jgi:hypothetical protein
LHGLASQQRLSVELNGKRLGNINVESAWQEISVTIPEDGLRQGENSLKLHLGKAGKAGGVSSYGLWQWIEVSAEGAPAGYGRALQPGGTVEVEGVSMPALRGFPRMIHLVEIPKTAWLDVKTSGSGRFEARLIDAEGNAHSLLSHESSKDAWQEHRVSLAKFADQLVRLELLTPKGGAWGGARIAL